MKFIRENTPGILLCAGIAVPAWILGLILPVIGGPVFAILLGVAAGMLMKKRKVFTGGIAFTSKKILQYAVILLGFGMNFSQILATGRQSLPIILSTISISLIIAFVMCRALKMDSKISILVGVGSSICGGSAIAATAPVIKANDEEIAQSISVIFFFNIIAALIFPTLGGLLGLSNQGFGLFAGTAINDTSSVTAAAAAWDGMHASNTLAAATIVKLTRTLAIIPITLVLAIYTAKKEKYATADFDLRRIFPFFILFFILAAVITTVFDLSTAVTDPIRMVSKYFIVMAMAAIGLNTNIVKLIKTGGKPLLMGVCCWIGIAGVSLLAQHVAGIW